MQYQKLTAEQRKVHRWRLRRNAMIGKLLADNPRMLRSEALARINQEMNSGIGTATKKRPKRRTPLSVLPKGPLAERLQASLQSQPAQLGGNAGATPSSIT